LKTKTIYAVLTDLWLTCRLICGYPRCLRKPFLT